MNHTKPANRRPTKASPRFNLSGVPQGSCLSPTLYLAYTNHVPLNQNARLYLFADEKYVYHL
ncbi:hypothetical protein QTP88_005546 [Uroleucon formosanum]